MTAEIRAATEHLVLRRMTNDDDALAAYRSAPAQARYQSWETPYTLDCARVLIAQMRNVRFGQPGVWLQTGIETGGRLIGDIAVRVEGDQARQATVGFTLAADAQGRVFATEALGAVMSLLFTEHEVHRISAACDTRNDRSVALLERIGMRREAHHHKSAWWKGEWTNEYVYAILAEEWADKKPRSRPTTAEHILGSLGRLLQRTTGAGP
ncbi:MAG: GNAT family protein [Streptomyces sp.]